MKTNLAAALAAIIFSVNAIGSPAASTPAPTLPAADNQKSAFYCDQAALDPERRKRHFEVLGPELIAKRKNVQELSDGYEFEFPSDSATYQHVAEWVDGERECCPFLDISLRVVAEHGPLKMRVTGRPGTKAFIQADGAEWINQ